MWNSRVCSARLNDRGCDCAGGTQVRGGACKMSPRTGAEEAGQMRETYNMKQKTTANH